MRRIPSDYMKNQKFINNTMRRILIDWLSEVQKLFKLIPETFFLTIDILDRYLSVSTSTSKDMLQLIGVTCMLIACKYEEIYAPECNDFIFIADNAFTKEDLLSMEQVILRKIDFYLTQPSPLHFLRRYSKAAGSDYINHSLCKYIIEMSTMDVEMLKYPPSMIAASSVLISRKMLGISPLWTTILEYFTRYTTEELIKCSIDLNDILKKSASWTLQSIRNKYNDAKGIQVSNIGVVDIDTNTIKTAL